MILLWNVARIQLLTVPRRRLRETDIDLSYYGRALPSRIACNLATYHNWSRPSGGYTSHEPDSRQRTVAVPR